MERQGPGVLTDNSVCIFRLRVKKNRTFFAFYLDADGFFFFLCLPLNLILGLTGKIC